MNQQIHNPQSVSVYEYSKLLEKVLDDPIRIKLEKARGAIGRAMLKQQDNIVQGKTNSIADDVQLALSLLDELKEIPFISSVVTDKHQFPKSTLHKENYDPKAQS